MACRDTGDERPAQWARHAPASAARGSKASFVSSQILLVWTKILFGHSNFGEKCYAHFTDSSAGSSSL